jgi:Ca2+-binding EF-hand superfamily protein
MNHTIRILGLAVVTIAVFAAGTASAQTAESRLEARFEVMDADHDGRISHDEYLAVAKKRAERLFRKLDSYHDGFLTSDELQKAREDIMDRQGGVPLRGVENRFNTMDANHDGKVSYDEFLTDWTARAEQQFKRLDANGDGYITREEFLTPREKLPKRMDNRSNPLGGPR